MFNENSFCGNILLPVWSKRDVRSAFCSLVFPEYQEEMTCNPTGKQEIIHAPWHIHTYLMYYMLTYKHTAYNHHWKLSPFNSLRPWAVRRVYEDVLAPVRLQIKLCFVICALPTPVAVVAMPRQKGTVLPSGNDAVDTKRCACINKILAFDNTIDYQNDFSFMFEPGVGSRPNRLIKHLISLDCLDNLDRIHSISAAFVSFMDAVQNPMPEIRSLKTGKVDTQTQHSPFLFIGMFYLGCVALLWVWPRPSKTVRDTYIHI